MNIRLWHAEGRRKWLAALAVCGLSLALAQYALAKPFAYIPNAGSHNVLVVDVDSATVTATVDVGSASIGVAAAPDGRRVYVTSPASNTLSVIGTATNTIIATIPVGARPYGVAVSPDGARVFVANQNSNTISVIDAVTNTVHPLPIPVGAVPTGVAVTPDGSRVYVTNKFSDSVSVIDAGTETVATTIYDLGSRPYGIAVSPDGARVYVAASGDFNYGLQVIDTPTNTLVATIRINAPVGVAVSPDGTRAYVTNFIHNDGSFVNTATDQLEGSFQVGLGPIGVAVTPDGSRILVANALGNDVSVIDASTKRELTTVSADKPIAFGQFIADVPNYACRSTAGLRSGGSNDSVRITNQGTATMPYTVQFVNAQGTVQGKPVAKTLTPSQSTSNTVGSLMLQAGIKTFNPAYLLQIVTGPINGMTESLLQSVYTPTNGSPPVMMVYTCEASVPAP